jgi:heme-degrading monooxygenase HmoA
MKRLKTRAIVVIFWDNKNKTKTTKKRTERRHQQAREKQRKVVQHVTAANAEFVYLQT